MKIRPQAAVQSCSRADLSWRQSATKIPTSTASTRIVGSLSNMTAMATYTGSFEGESNIERPEERSPITGTCDLRNALYIMWMQFRFREGVFDLGRKLPLYCDSD